MTPGARVQAAIECLERTLAGEPAEKVLTLWARGARYAGSKDRAAVRDHVYDVLRRRKACAAAGGGAGARALMLGLIRLGGGDPAMLFSGEGHAPAALDPDEAQAPAKPEPEVPEVPDWLLPQLEAAYGGDCAAELAHLGQRAEVFLRVNLRKTDPARAAAMLEGEGIATAPAALAEAALVVTDGARRIAGSMAYQGGFVELQDAASQAAMETIPLRNGMKILDFCAGGGGKTLALAGRVEAAFFAHDAAPGRMRDLGPRAARAGVAVTQLSPAGLAASAPFDLVLCDVPCSGSGTWRRDPDAKWRFTPERLAELNALQDAILDDAAALVAPGGMLAYATCSLLDAENAARIQAFAARHPGWRTIFARQWRLSDGADGFFAAHLRREE